MSRTQSANERAAPALQLICTSRNASGGHLFLLSVVGLHLSASFGSAGAPPELREVQDVILRASQRDEEMEEMSTGELAAETDVVSSVHVGSTHYELLLPVVRARW